MKKTQNKAAARKIPHYFWAIFLSLMLLSSLAFADEIVRDPAKDKSYLENVSINHSDVVLSVIETQLRAIRDRDDRVAYDANTDNVKEKHSDPQSFMRMIRQKKKALYNHVHYEIIEPTQPNPKFYNVSLIDRRGNTVTAMFKMKQGDRGAWGVDKIILLKTEEDPI